MHHETTTRPSAVPIRNGILMLSGFGIKVATERNHLVVSDGVGRQRREGRFAKATSGIKRTCRHGANGLHVIFSCSLVKRRKSRVHSTRLRRLDPGCVDRWTR